MSWSKAGSVTRFFTKSTAIVFFGLAALSLAAGVIGAALFFVILGVGSCAAVIVAGNAGAKATAATVAAGSAASAAAADLWRNSEDSRRRFAEMTKNWSAAAYEQLRAFVNEFLSELGSYERRWGSFGGATGDHRRWYEDRSSSDDGHARAANAFDEACMVLGVLPDTDMSVVHSRWRTLIKQCHPDHFQNDLAKRREMEERAKVINAAYDLIKQVRRAAA